MASARTTSANARTTSRGWTVPVTSSVRTGASARQGPACVPAISSDPSATSRSATRTATRTASASAARACARRASRVNSVNRVSV